MDSDLAGPILFGFRLKICQLILFGFKPNFNLNDNRNLNLDLNLRDQLFMDLDSNVKNLDSNLEFSAC